MDDIYRLNDAAAPPLGFTFWEDFIREDSVADGGTFDWTAVGSGTVATLAANGGFVTISGAATTDNSGGQIQAQAAHSCLAGKNIFFKTTAQLNETTSSNGATQSDLYLGLFPVDTSIIASLPDNGVYFVKADDGTAVQCVVRAAGTNSVADTLAMTFDKLSHNYGIFIHPTAAGVGDVEFMVDGVCVSRANGVTLPASSVILTPSVAFQSGDNTGTKFVNADYVGTYQAR